MRRKRGYGLLERESGVMKVGEMRSNLWRWSSSLEVVRQVGRLRNELRRIGIARSRVQEGLLLTLARLTLLL